MATTQALPDIKFRTYSTDHYLSERSRGFNGEIPKIRIQKDQAIPPLDKVAYLKVDFFHSERPEESTLWLAWTTAERIRFSIQIDANDPRMKSQYATHSGILAQIELLLQDEEIAFGKKPEDRNTFRQEVVLEHEEIPTDLQAAFDQVEKWRKFVGAYQRDFFNLSRISYVTGDGWYIVCVMGYEVLAPPETFDEEVELSLSREFHAKYGTRNRFDPGDQQPGVGDDGVCWCFPEEKVVVVMLYGDMTDHIAKHFGCWEALRAYRERKEEARKDFWLCMRKGDERSSKFSANLHQALTDAPS